jgi:hypothetical protein
MHSYWSDTTNNYVLYVDTALDAGLVNLFNIKTNSKVATIEFNWGRELYAPRMNVYYNNDLVGTVDPGNANWTDGYLNNVTLTSHSEQSNEQQSNVLNEPNVYYKSRSYQLHQSLTPSILPPYIRIIDTTMATNETTGAMTFIVNINLFGSKGVSSYSVGFFEKTVDVSAMTTAWPANKGLFTTTQITQLSYAVESIQLQITATSDTNELITENKEYNFVIVAEDSSGNYGKTATIPVSTIPIVADKTILQDPNVDVYRLSYLDSYISWPDLSSTPMRVGMGGTGADYILKTPQVQTNLVGDLTQVVTCGGMILAMDSNKHIYVQFGSYMRLPLYQFYVDPTLTALTGANDNYTNEGYLKFVRATNLEAILEPIYGPSGENTQVKKIYNANQNGFFIEFENGSIHLIVTYSITNVPKHGPYFSVHTTNTITSLPNPDPNVKSWTLVNTIKTGWAACLVVFKRTGATAPYHAFQNETTQYGVNDETNGNNVRVFALTYNTYSVDGPNLSSPTAGQFTTTNTTGLLNSSTSTIGISDNANVNATQLENGSESKYQYWLTKNLEAMFQLGLLPTRKIHLGFAALVAFESDDGSQIQWHLFNTAINYATYDLNNQVIFGKNAQYLLLNNESGIDSNATQFSTILQPYDLTTITGGTNAPYNRVQDVMNAILLKGDNTLDDVVFLNHHWQIRSTTNAIRLQAYIKSTHTFWTLVAGATPTLVEMPAIKTGESVNLDEKNSTSSSTWGKHSRGYNYLMMPGRITDPVVMFDTLGVENNGTSFIITQRQT